MDLSTRDLVLVANVVSICRIKSQRSLEEESLSLHTVGVREWRKEESGDDCDEKSVFTRPRWKEHDGRRTSSENKRDKQSANIWHVIVPKSDRSARLWRTSKA